MEPPAPKKTKRNNEEEERAAAGGSSASASAGGLPLLATAAKQISIDTFTAYLSDLDTYRMTPLRHVLLELLRRHPSELNQKLYDSVSNSITDGRRSGEEETYSDDYIMRQEIERVLIFHEPGLRDLLRHPSLCQDQHFWERLLLKTGFNFTFDNERVDLEELMRLCAPMEVRSDDRLMLGAAAHDETCLRLLAPNLATNREFLHKAFEEAVSPWALVFMSDDAQMRYPDLVRRAFDLMSDEDELILDLVIDTACNLAPEIWDDRLTVLHWFECGLPFFATGPRSRWQRSPFQNMIDDREICLTIARYSREDFLTLSFENAAHSLRSEREFMKEAITITYSGRYVSTSLYESASDDLQQDFDFALRFYSSGVGLTADVESYLMEDEESYFVGRDDFVKSFHKRVKEMLIAHDLFFCTFLCGMRPGSSSTLEALAQGAETAIGYKRLIGEYMGAPLGKPIALLRQANENLDLFFDGENEV